MNQTTLKCCKFILTTYKDSSGRNTYSDSTFNLRPPFRPNSNGVYKVTLNEAMFKNNEPTLRADQWIKWTINTRDTNPDANGKYPTHQYDIKWTVLQNWFTYADVSNSGVDNEAVCLKLFESATDLTWVQKTVEKSTDVIPDEKKTYRTTLPANVTDFTVKVLDGALNSAIAEYKYFPQLLRLQVKAAITNTLDENITSIDLSYSTDFMYLLNDARASISNKITAPAKTFDNCIYDFYNIRFCGAYIYIIDTPLQSVVNTYNSNNQGYNIIALTYNMSGYHNGNQQCVSTMEVTTNDLSNLRIRLLNDQYETIELYEPIYLQFTVSNED